MSGGSLSYLYNKQFPEVCNYIGEMKKAEKELISQGYTDIARDVRRLIEYCLTAENAKGILNVVQDNMEGAINMSGGSLSYLYNKEFPEVCNYIDEMKKVEKELISQGYTDIARDVRRLIEYCLTAENRISVLFDNLSDVSRSVV